MSSRLEYVTQDGLQLAAILLHHSQVLGLIICLYHHSQLNNHVKHQCSKYSTQIIYVISMNQNQDPTICNLQEIPFKYEDTHSLKG